MALILPIAGTPYYISTVGLLCYKQLGIAQCTGGILYSEQLGIAQFTEGCYGVSS